MDNIVQLEHNTQFQLKQLLYKKNRDKTAGWGWCEKDGFLFLWCHLCLFASLFQLVCIKLKGLLEERKEHKCSQTDKQWGHMRCRCACVSVSPLLKPKQQVKPPWACLNSLHRPSRLSRFIFKSPLIHKQGICSALPKHTRFARCFCSWLINQCFDPDKVSGWVLFYFGGDKVRAFLQITPASHIVHVLIHVVTCADSCVHCRRKERSQQGFQTRVHRVWGNIIGRAVT